MHRLPRIALLFVLAVLVGACSVARIGYGNAPSLAQWWLDQYFDFSPEQNQLVEGRLAQLHVWHRRNELPGYADFLADARKLIDRPLTAADALRLGDSVASRIRGVAAKARPDIADLLASLTPEQIDRLESRFADRNKEYVKEAALDGDEAAQHDARSKRLLSRAEYWFGAISDEQRRQFRALLASRPSGARFWYEERLRRQRELVDIARRVQREKPGRDATIALLRTYQERFDVPADPARAAKAQSLRQDTADVVVALHAMATPEQRNHARERVDDLIRDITALAADS